MFLGTAVPLFGPALLRLLAMSRGLHFLSAWRRTG